MTQELQNIANFQGSEPLTTERAGSKRDEKTALELLTDLSNERNRSLTIRRGKLGQWSIELAGYNGKGYHFLDAVSSLFAEMFPELKAKVEAEKRALEEEKMFLGHA